MRNTFHILFLVTVLSLPALAQATVEGGVGLHFNNARNQNDVFGYLAGDYTIADKFKVGASVYGDFSRTNPKVTARSTYQASFKFLDRDGWDFSVGGGGYKVGNEVGGYGGLGMNYRGFEAWGKYGTQNFTEAEAFYPLYASDRLQFGPVFHYTNMDGIVAIQRGGVKIRFTQ